MSTFSSIRREYLEQREQLIKEQQSLLGQDADTLKEQQEAELWNKIAYDNE